MGKETQCERPLTLPLLQAGSLARLLLLLWFEPPSKEDLLESVIVSLLLLSYFLPLPASHCLWFQPTRTILDS